jgi:hypothetical protein
MKIRYTLEFEGREDIDVNKAQTTIDGLVRSVRLVQPGTEPLSSVERIPEKKEKKEKVGK